MLFLVSAHSIQSLPFHDCISALPRNQSIAVFLPASDFHLGAEHRSRRRPMPFLDSSSSTVEYHARVIQAAASVPAKLIKSEQRTQRTIYRMGRARVSMIFSHSRCIY